MKNQTILQRSQFESEMLSTRGEVTAATFIGFRPEMVIGDKAHTGATKGRRAALTADLKCGYLANGADRQPSDMRRQSKRPETHI